MAIDTGASKLISLALLFNLVSQSILYSWLKNCGMMEEGWEEGGEAGEMVSTSSPYGC